MQTVAQKFLQNNVIVRHATFDGEHGLACKDAQGAVWFMPDSGALPTLLHDVDAPALVLHGRLDLIETQRAADERFGSLLGLVDHRQSEHARVAA